MTVDEFNALPFEKARSTMLGCCGSEAWAVEMTAKRPFKDFAILCETAEAQWWQLGEFGWLEALRAHPRTGAWTDVSTLNESDEEIAERMALLHSYYATFGFGFIYYSVGRTAEEIRLVLKQRLENRVEQEIANAAEEQAKVTELKLKRLFQA